ncbi:hypothetical protein QTP88_012840 [Uroleucon formosanum]
MCELLKMNIKFKISKRDCCVITNKWFDKIILLRTKSENFFDLIIKIYHCRNMVIREYPSIRCRCPKNKFGESYVPVLGKN